jgi:hypothetical protein
MKVISTEPMTVSELKAYIEYLKAKQVEDLRPHPLNLSPKDLARVWKNYIEFLQELIEPYDFDNEYLTLSDIQKFSDYLRTYVFNLKLFSYENPIYLYSGYTRIFRGIRGLSISSASHPWFTRISYRIGGEPPKIGDELLGFRLVRNK